MLVLANTTDAIEVVLGGAITTNQLTCVASWRETTSTTMSLGKSVTTTNSTTAVDLVTGPASGSTYRVIDFISVYNRDTVNATVTIKYDENGTEAIITKVTLRPGERVEYSDGVGFQVYTAAGEVKTSTTNAAEALTTGLSIDILTSDVAQAGTANAIADVTGLTFAVTSGTGYWFRFVIWYTSAATSTGSRWTINGPATTALYYRSEYSLTSTTRTRNEGLSAYDGPAASNATSAATGSNIAIVEGYVLPSANGSIIARVANEVNASAITAKAGSFVLYKAL